MPERSPAVVSETPPGNDPLKVKVGAGEPDAVTLNDPAVPTIKVVLVPLVNAGAAPMSMFTLTVWLSTLAVPVPVPVEPPAV